MRIQRIVIALLFLPSLVFGAGNSLIQYQRCPDDTCTNGWLLGPPASDSVYIYNKATEKPDLMTLPTAIINSSGNLIFNGTSGQYLRGDGAFATLPTPAAQSINNSPGRGLVTSTSATGFQISSTRNAQACYEGTTSTTSTIGGPAGITVFLETADTNSTNPGDWTTIAQQVNSNTITLAVALQSVDIEPWSMCRIIAAGKFTRVRSGSVTGTASATINTQQQETLL